MKHKYKLIFLFITIIIFVGCEEDSPDIDVESSIPVRVEEVIHNNIKEYAFATGTVQAINELVVKAQQSGYYRLQTNPRTGKPFAMGDKVRQGEIIIILFNPEYENQIAFDSKKLNYEMSEREYEKQQKRYFIR